MTDFNDLLACPRCDKTPLDDKDTARHCRACDVDFPSLNGIPWMFAEPQASLGEWRGRLQFALQQLSHEVAGLDQELKDKNLRELSPRAAHAPADRPGAQYLLCQRAPRLGMGR